jgi:hypothetical protein
MRTVIRTILASVVAAGACAAIAQNSDFASFPAIAVIIAVPEPMTMSLIGFSLIGLGTLNRKHQP